MLREKDDDEFHEHHISQDHEQRGQDHRTGGRTAHALGASPGAHPLKAGDQPDDQSKDSGLKRGWQEIIETCAVKAADDELVERERLNQWSAQPSPLASRMQSAARVSRGSIRMQARMRVAASSR